MALILFGGFEMGTHNGEFNGVDVPVIVPYSGNGSNSIQAGGRSGLFYNRISRNTSSEFADRTAINFPSVMPELFFQAALAQTHVGKYATSDVKVLRWLKDTTVLGGIWYRAGLDIMEVYTGDFATLVGSFPAPPGNSIYWVFEIHLVVGDSGLIEIRRDMNLVFTFAGDTKPGADTGVNKFEISAAMGSSEANFHYLDDFVLNDPTGPAPMNSWPGGLRIACLTPNSDDGLNQWTPTPGPTHYTAIDEKPPSEVDYLLATAVDLEERFGLSDLPVTAQVVHAVKVIATARKESANAPDKIAVGLEIGGTPYYSGDLILLTSAAGATKQWVGHPSGSGTLSVADINGAKLLIKSRG